MINALAGKLIGGGIAIALGSVAINMAFNHYQDLQKSAAQVPVLESALADADIENERLRTEIDKAVAQFIANQKTVQLMADTVKEMGRETRKYQTLFGKHDLEKLSISKPAAIKKRINSGTARSLRLLECAAGATNNACPEGPNTPDN